MGSGKKGPNAKAVAGREKKAENAAKKAMEEERKREAAEAAEWRKGANLKRAAKDEEAARKADEAARKRREKQELLAQEEAELGSGAKVKRVPTAKSKKKGKPKNDLAMLEEELQKQADKKVRKKKVEQMEKKQQEETAPAKEEAPVDPLLANTQKLIGVADDEEEVGRQANKALMEEGASGIDAALSSLNIKSPAASQATSAKALYKEFEERMLPVVKEERPGLRLSQYKEEIFKLWKKSPENPHNQIPPSTK